MTRDLELIVTVHLDEDYHKTSYANFIEIMLAENDGTDNCPSDKVHRLPFGKLRLSLRLYFFPELFFILFSNFCLFMVVWRSGFWEWGHRLGFSVDEVWGLWRAVFCFFGGLGSLMKHKRITLRKNFASLRLMIRLD